MKYKVYIYNDTFATLTSILQKGLQQGLNFYIYDEQDAIQNRIWTFSQPAFIPNVKADDDILKTTKVPVVISTIIQPPIENYKVILYRSLSSAINIDEGIIIVEAKNDLQKMIETMQIKPEDCEVYVKNQNSWGRVLV
jgi:hypothetical protein